MKLPTHLPVADSDNHFVCCECGEQFEPRKDLHECNCIVDARRAGWWGFSSPISVKQLDGTRRLEHLGLCPCCKPEETP